MTTDPLKPPDARHRYVNVVSGLVRLVREEGVQGLLRGLIPNTVHLHSVMLNSLADDTRFVARRGQF